MRTQTELALALSQAREHTDALFQLVRPDSLYERPIPERHRIIFYIGHLEAFDWNLIGRYALDLRSFHPEFDRLFAFGIDPPPGKLPEDTASDWPSLSEVDRYNQRTRDEIDEVLDAVPDQLLHVAIEHRLMHAETLAYILHNLAYERKTRPPETLNAPVEHPVSMQMIDIPSGATHLGRNPEEGFGWDNEFQPCMVDVPAFSIAKYKVTNGEYLKFVDAGAPAPFYWTERAGRWFYRGMFFESPLPLDAPVYATHSQADAYARWRGKALPTEAQFHRAASLSTPSRNADFRHWDPVSVTADDQAGEPAGRPSQMVGNGWEWTSTPFAPFPGFEPFPFYTNYSAPFFDGEHYVLKGAGPRTAACFLRPSFRNWFRPEYPYIDSTFRLVES